MEADPGRDIPRASARAFIVLAVPIVLQCPTLLVSTSAVGKLEDIRRGGEGDSLHHLCFVEFAFCEQLSAVPDNSSGSNKLFAGVSCYQRDSVADIPLSIGPTFIEIAGMLTVAAAISRAGVLFISSCKVVWMGLRLVTSSQEDNTINRVSEQDLDQGEVGQISIQHCSRPL
jgi:hypothetical protein